MLPNQQPTLFRLPNGKAVSALGFGCSSLWAKPDFDDTRAHEILVAARAAGINHFDTGPSYGVGEERLGAFLAGRDLSRLVVSTKVGTGRDMVRSFDPDQMRRSFDASLRRLGIAKVDILYLHGPALEDLTVPVLNFLADCKAAGKIDMTGVNSFDPQVLVRLVDLPIDVVMLQYSVADQSASGLIERLYAAGKAVVAGTAMGRAIYGLRAFVPLDRRSLWYLLRALRKDPLFMFKGLRLAARLTQVDSDPHSAAIRFAASHPLLVGSLFGSTSVAHIKANTAAARRGMSEQERALLTEARWR